MVAEHALHHWYHEAKVEGVCDGNDRHFHFPTSECNDREKHILNDGWASSIHLLNKFPYSLVNDEIVLLLLDIVSELIFMIKEFGIIDTP